jgi:hypothetical protein
MTLIPTRHVYFSLTEQNPFLPAWYVSQLKDDLDPKLARRLLFGEWLEITGDVIYHQYLTERNFRAYDYEIDESLPIYLSWDFNIGQGKPLSLCLSQYLEHKDEFHFFDEVIIEGASTEDACDELASRGLLDLGTHYIVHGDATGGSRTTKSKTSDYDIIRKYLANYRQKTGEQLNFDIDVPKANPPIRTRHNLVNAYCQSASGKVRFFVYQKAATLAEGMRLTVLKKGGSYIEDDSKKHQHVTTAAGYHVHRCHGARRDGAPRVQNRQVR